MAHVDLILITQSEVVGYGEYAKLPIERIDLYRDLVFPRMIYYKGGFRPPLEVLNDLQHGRFYSEATPRERRHMYSVWNLPGFVGPHLANFLLESGIRTRVINNIDAEWDVFEEAYTQCGPPPLVGISTTFHLSFAELSRLCKRLRGIDPNMVLVAGGAFVNTETLHMDLAAFERPMRKHRIRHILHGFNSEVDLRDLILRRKKDDDPNTVLNQAFISGEDPHTGTFGLTQQTWHDPILNGVPPLWDQLDLPFVNHTVQLRTASGCPFECAFCSYPETAHGSHRMEVAEVERHLASVLRAPGVSRVVFIDDTFNVPPDRFEELCRLFCKYEFEWFSFLRCQFIDRDTAQLMRDSGCVAVYLGIESANDTVLENMNKRATRAQFARGIEHLRDAGIASVAAFVLGFPGETEATIRENVEFIESSGVEFYTLKDFYYMEHTPIYRDRKAFRLEGSGAKWRHATMDSETAQRHRLNMFAQIENSVFVDPDTSLWYLAYLYDQGFALDQVRQIQERINTVMKEQLAGNYDPMHPALKSISDHLARRGLPT